MALKSKYTSKDYQRMREISGISSKLSKIQKDVNLNEKLSDNYNTKPVKDIKNQYSDDKNNTSPWYELEYNKNTKIVFGDRKRVISLKVKHYEISVPLHKDLEALAKEKNITFNRNIDKYSQEVEIHAWSEEDFVQYFKMVIEETNKNVK